MFIRSHKLWNHIRLNQMTCIHHCISIYLSLVDIGICGLPAVQGDCGELIVRYYYDVINAECRQFSYGGCNGNENNFETREECQSSCNYQGIVMTFIDKISC